jgi:hypothetical protein
LEKAVEDLSELLESPIDPEAISTLRQKVTDKTVRCFSTCCYHILILIQSSGLCRETQRDIIGGYFKWFCGGALEVEYCGRGV